MWLHILITGKVQGVYYRASTQKKSNELGIVGWVRNLADGRVEVLAMGSTSGLNSLLDWCQFGPRMANVANLEACWAKDGPAFTAFEIMPTAQSPSELFLTRKA